jgi:chromosome segregation ATPase
MAVASYSIAMVQAMTNEIVELVERLRAAMPGTHGGNLMDEAAAALEQLSAELADSKKARSLLRQWLWNAMNKGEEMEARIAELEAELLTEQREHLSLAGSYSSATDRIAELEAALRYVTAVNVGNGSWMFGRDKIYDKARAALKGEG